ncbi:hypothetical protein [Streptococcus sp. sy010]|uniref:hypothetical protein n=1 Tax=Streptococcus sp. sy010 TaxID=2600148 RepID=UPI0011B7B2CF|nr:hypothetical protein [Streptococcus sp. sy010]TWT16294.1 hypothetical protein FRX51_03135 [Streptococcus sp. sy010]
MGQIDYLKWILIAIVVVFWIYTIICDIILQKNYQKTAFFQAFISAFIVEHNVSDKVNSFSIIVFLIFVLIYFDFKKNNKY